MNGFYHIWTSELTDGALQRSLVSFGPIGDRTNVDTVLAGAIAELNQQIQELKDEVKSLKEKSRERNKRQSYE